MADSQLRECLGGPSGLIYHISAPTGWGLWVSLAGFGAGFGLLLAAWLAGGGGMGDLKLLATWGAWLRAKHLLVAMAIGDGRDRNCQVRVSSRLSDL